MLPRRIGSLTTWPWSSTFASLRAATSKMATAPVSRTREKATGDEEATADLKLGEFQSVPTLTLSEARLLINAVMDHRKLQRKVEETEYVLPLKLAIGVVGHEEVIGCAGR